MTSGTELNKEDEPMMFCDWALNVFGQHMNEFHVGGNWSMSVFFCYVCCASEIVRLKGNYKWFARPVDDMAKDTNISARTAARYLSELCQEGLIERQRRVLGAKMHLMARATDKELEGREFLVEEVEKLSHDEAEAFLS